jgi:hypothetical protein
MTPSPASREKEDARPFSREAGEGGRRSRPDEGRRNRLANFREWRCGSTTFVSERYIGVSQDKAADDVSRTAVPLWWREW